MALDNGCVILSETIKDSLERHTLLIAVPLEICVELASVIVPLTRSDSPMLVGISRLRHRQVSIFVTAAKLRKVKTK